MRATLTNSGVVGRQRSAQLVKLWRQWPLGVQHSPRYRTGEDGVKVVVAAESHIDWHFLFVIPGLCGLIGQAHDLLPLEQVGDCCAARVDTVEKSKAFGTRKKMQWLHVCGVLRKKQPLKLEGNRTRTTSSACSPTADSAGHRRPE